MSYRHHSRRWLAGIAFCGALGSVGSASAVAISAHATTLGARPEPGSGFSSYTLAVDSSGIHVLADSIAAPLHPLVTLDAPWAQTSFQPGPLGYALGSIVWPGGTDANLGTLVQVLGIPTNALTQALNDPVRAEAHNGEKPIVDTTYPGVVMSAAVGPYTSDAAARLATPAANKVLDVSAASTTAATRLLTAERASASGTADLEDISIGGGLIHIGSIVTQVTAATEGTTTSVHRATKVLDATVAGIPVSITRSGIEVAANKLGALAAPAEALVGKLLQGLGLSIDIPPPTRTGKRGNLTFVTSALEVRRVSNALSSATATIDLGRVEVQADAVKSLPFSEPTAPSPPASTSATTTTPGTDAMSLPPLGTSTAPQSDNPPVIADTQPVAASLPALTAAMSGWWVVLVLALAGGLGFVLLRRVPAALGGARSCPDEET
jgi:hypothetical protein